MHRACHWRRLHIPGTAPAPQLLPADIDPAGLEVIAGYKAARDSGTVFLRLPRSCRRGRY